jgi:hypothetical protein
MQTKVGFRFRSCFKPALRLCEPAVQFTCVKPREFRLWMIRNGSCVSRYIIDCMYPTHRWVWILPVLLFTNFRNFENQADYAVVWIPPRYTSLLGFFFLIYTRVSPFSYFAEWLVLFIFGRSWVRWSPPETGNCEGDFCGFPQINASGASLISFPFQRW